MSTLKDNSGISRFPPQSTTLCKKIESIEQMIEKSIYQSIQVYQLQTHRILFINSLRWKESLCKIGFVIDDSSYSIFIEHLSDRETIDIYLSVSDPFTIHHSKYLFIFENLIKMKLSKVNKYINIYLNSLSKL